MSKVQEKKQTKVPNDTIHETVIYYFKVACPYCNAESTIEMEIKPRSYHCDECEKEFSIKYTN